MAQYVSCEFCGANLDFGEKCDCIKKEGAPPQPVHPTGKNPVSILPRKRTVVKINGGKAYGT